MKRLCFEHTVMLGIGTCEEEDAEGVVHSPITLTVSPTQHGFRGRIIE